MDIDYIQITQVLPLHRTFLMQNCPECGTSIPNVGDAFCPLCRAELPEYEAPRTERGNVLALPKYEGGVPLSHSTGFGAASWPALVFTPLFCLMTVAFWFSESGSFGLDQPLILAIGGGVGLLLGMVIFLDHRRVQAQVDAYLRSFAQEPEVNIATAPSLKYAVVLLIFPIAVGASFLFADRGDTARTVVRWLSYSLVPATAALGYLDMRRLLLEQVRAQREIGPAASPVACYLGMLAVWIVFYPVYFVARRRVAPPNLLLPAFVSAATFVFMAYGYGASSNNLPRADSTIVVTTLKKAIESSPNYQMWKTELGPITIRNAVEVSYDTEAQRRIGRAEVVTRRGVEEVTYAVEWQGEGRRAIWVSVVPPAQ